MRDANAEAYEADARVYRRFADFAEKRGDHDMARNYRETADEYDAYASRIRNGGGN